MEKTLNFNAIAYHRPNTEMLMAQYDALDRQLDDASRALDRVNDAITSWDRLRSRIHTLNQIITIRYHQDTSDPFLQTEKRFFDDLEPLLKERDLAIGKRLVTHPLRSQLEAHWGKQFFLLYETQLKTFTPAIADEMRLEAELGRRYTDLLAQAQVEFSGKSLTLSELRRYTMSPDRRERMEAQRVRASFFKANDGELDGMYQELVL